MAVSVVSFSFSWCSICWVITFFTASYQHLLWTPIQSGTPSPFGLVWPSLPHLVYNSVRSLTVWLLSWLLSSSGNNCHAGHSLPVHQSWEFFTSSHFICQFLPTQFPLITAIRMCHFLPVHHLGMAFLAGSKAKIQQMDQGEIATKELLYSSKCSKSVDSSLDAA